MRSKQSGLLFSNVARKCGQNLDWVRFFGTLSGCGLTRRKGAAEIFTRPPPGSDQTRITQDYGL